MQPVLLDVTWQEMLSKERVSRMSAKRCINLVQQWENLCETGSYDFVHQPGLHMR